MDINKISDVAKTAEIIEKKFNRMETVATLPKRSVLEKIVRGCLVTLGAVIGAAGIVYFMVKTAKEIVQDKFPVNPPTGAAETTALLKAIAEAVGLETMNQGILVALAGAALGALFGATVTLKLLEMYDEKCLTHTRSVISSAGITLKHTAKSMALSLEYKALTEEQLAKQIKYVEDELTAVKENKHFVNQIGAKTIASLLEELLLKLKDLQGDITPEFNRIPKNIGIRQVLNFIPSAKEIGLDVSKYRSRKLEDNAIHAINHLLNNWRASQ